MMDTNEKTGADYFAEIFFNLEQGEVGDIFRFEGILFQISDGDKIAVKIAKSLGSEFNNVPMKDLESGFRSFAFFMLLSGAHSTAKKVLREEI